MHCTKQAKSNVAGEQAMKKKYIFAGIFAIYLIFMIRIILLKDIPISRILDYTGRTRAVNMIPLYSIYDFLFSGTAGFKQIWTNILGNIAVFIPLGMLVPVLFGRKKLSEAVIAGACVSIVLEIVQFVFALGISDVDDVILNVIGGITGWLIYRLIQNVGLPQGVKDNLYIAVFLFMGIGSLTIILLTNSEIIVRFDKKTLTENEELVSHINVKRPDFYGKIVEYDGKNISVKSDDEATDFAIDDGTSFYKQEYSDRSLLGQVVEENIVYKNISYDEFSNTYSQGLITDKISIWSSDGKHADGLMIFEWEFD